MREKITELNHTISNLKSIQQALVSRHQDMSTILNIDLASICIIEQKRSYLVTVPTNANASAETEIESMINKAKQYQLHHLHDAAYGSMIPVESLYQGDFQNYSALYFELPTSTSKRGLHTKPAGKYLRAFCKGSWDKLPGRYKEILIGAKPHIAYETEEDQVIAGLVAQGFGIAVVPYMELLLKLDLNILQISSPPCERSFYMVYNGAVFMPPAVRRFRDFVLSGRT